LQGLVQAGEVRDHPVDAGDREHTQNHGAGRDHQPQLATLGQGAQVKRE
jgi:hypothetical protein